MNILSKGIDVSSHNTIDWNKVNKSEFDFIIIRSSYGSSTVDKQFKTNIENAIKLNIPIGIYHFGYSTTVAEAKAEADFCLKTIAPYKSKIVMPVFFDWEDDSYNYAVKKGITPTKTLISDMAVAFMTKIQGAGYKTGNYSNVNYLKNYFNNTVKDNYDTWLAHVKDGNGNPLEKSTYTGSYTIHQYSWVGKFSGITGNVDTNYCYKDYIGSSTATTTITTTTASSKYLVDYSNEQDSKVVTYNSSTQGSLYLSPHFQVKEFKSPDSTAVKIDNRLVWILERLFTDLNCSKMVINSGYRTAAYSVKVGGTSTDKHVEGKAADITAYDKNGKVIDAKTVCIKLCDYGNVFGIGYISVKSVHIDSRDKSSIWYGDETTNTSLIKSGYTSFTEYFNAKTLTVNSGTWNIRDKASLLGKVVTVVGGNKTYKYTKISNNWAYIPELKGWLGKAGYKI